MMTQGRVIVCHRSHPTQLYVQVVGNRRYQEDVISIVCDYFGSLMTVLRTYVIVTPMFAVMITYAKL